MRSVHDVVQNAVAASTATRAAWNLDVAPSNEAWIFGGKSPALLVELLDAQADDVASAVSYVRHLPGVDANRVALVGCSFGGIETLLGAEQRPASWLP